MVNFNKILDINIYVVRQNFTTKDMLHNFNETLENKQLMTSLLMIYL